MAYNKMEDDPGSAVPEASEDQAPRGDTFFLPTDFPGLDALKPGATITLKVVGKGEDGQVEVEHMPEGGAMPHDDMMDDLRASQPESES